MLTACGGKTPPNNGDIDTTPVLTTIRNLDVTVIKTAERLGDAIIVRLPDGKNMLVDSGNDDTGSNNSLNTKLNALNVTTIDYFIVTNPSPLRSGGGKFVFDNFIVKNFYRPNVKSTHASAASLPTAYNSGSTNSDSYEYSGYPYADLLVAAHDETGCSVNIINKDSDISYKFKYNNQTYEYKIDFLTPLATPASSVSFANREDYSPIILIEYNNKKIMLTSDTTATGETTYNTTYSDTIDIDVLVAANHGDAASTSLAFLNNVKPEYVIIPSNTNDYGFPAESVVTRITDYGATLYRTDEDGNITFTINTAGTLSVATDN